MIKFKLRKFKKGDEESLRKNINDFDIYKSTLNIPYPYTKKDAKFWVNHSLKLNKSKNPETINFVIDINNEVAGSVGLIHINRKNNNAEIEYWLAKKYWGNGITTKAVKDVVNFAFNKLKIKRIYAHVFPFNKASTKVLEKNGFKFEGKLRKSAKKNNKYYDSLLCSIIK